MHDITKEFYNKFEMKVLPSQHRLRRMKPLHLRTEVWNTHLTDELVWNLTDAAEEVRCVDIVMPEDKLVELERWLEHYEQVEEAWQKHSVRSDEIWAQHHKDAKVRIKNPAVKQAYDHYVTLLNLCRD
jgi:hypothetical protein